MLYAIAYPEAKRGRGHKDEAVKDEETSPFTRRLLQMGRLVLREAPDLVDLVLAGKSLDEGEAEAQQRAHPEMTDRQIARIARVSHPTVAKAREANGNTFPL